MMKYFHPLKNTLHVKLYYRVPPPKKTEVGERAAHPPVVVDTHYELYIPELGIS